MNKDLSPFEIRFIETLVLTGFEFVKLEPRIVCILCYQVECFMNTVDPKAENVSSDSSDYTVTKSGLDYTVLNSLRYHYLKLFMVLSLLTQPENNRSYVGSVFLVMQKIEEILTYHNTPNSEYASWEWAEVALWLLTEIGLLYFLHPTCHRDQINKFLTLVHGVIPKRSMQFYNLLNVSHFQTILIVCLF
ncbi:hypothetical protein RF11_14545 [Thelohanellus kitauei]|uniref:Uncharacterized protein n=1 Tax=Thelohanellus kitauei TaxID=669202 RepID=A0A0C2JMJ1_THEKT|nr:hypothetical protein RF11_14545 [Thelohanellus kitauei]